MRKTKRNDYNKIPIDQCKALLDKDAKKYLLHRYDVNNDKFIWPLILEECDLRGESIVHLDFSV